MLGMSGENIENYMGTDAIILISIIILSIGIFLVIITLRTYKNRIITGQQGLIGRIGVVTVKLEPEGKIKIDGEIWNAISDKPVKVGEEVEIIKVSGMKLTVEKTN